MTSSFLHFLTYKTPAYFAQKFTDHYIQTNLKQVKILSIILFLISVSTRGIALLYPTELHVLPNFFAFSINNWFQIISSTLFFILSNRFITKTNIDPQKIKILYLAFILFILTTTLAVSYTVSMYNTKNTLTVFLLGIVTVCLFFTLEYKQILNITIFIILLYFFSMVFPKISLQEKLMNMMAGIMLGIILLCFSRYNFILKSQHFVRFKQLEEKTIEVEHLNNQKDEILGFVAHDLRTPINNIEALSNIIQLENADMIEAKLISTAVGQAKLIINDLLETAKIEHSHLKTESMAIDNTIETFVDKWRNNCDSVFNLTLIGKPIMVPLNSSKLERVFDNLISNAIKFSNQNLPIEITISEFAEEVQIAIKDYGIGIPSHLNEFIFLPFSKSGRPGLQGEKSIGLGLHIAKKIIEQHRGKLTFTSKEHVGTIFTISLPKS